METYCYVIRVDVVFYGQPVKHADAFIVFRGIF